MTISPSSEFLAFVQDCESRQGHDLDWRKAIYHSTITINDVEVPVLKYIMGRNASHQFAIATDGEKWYKVYDGEDAIPVAKWTKHDVDHFRMLRDAAAGIPTDFYSKELAESALSDYTYNETGEVVSMWGGCTTVSECTSFEDAISGYMGHW